MSQRPNVCSRTDPSPEPGLFAIPIQNFELFDLDQLGFKLDLLLFAGELIRRDTADLFSRKWRWDLFNLSYECTRGLLNLLQGQMDWLFWTLGLAFGVVGVCGQSEFDGPFVPFISNCVKLGQTGETSQDQRQDASRRRIEGSQMAHRALAGNATHPGDHVMGGHSTGVVDY